MHRRSLAALTAIAVAGGSLGAAAPAHADSTTLYVRQGSLFCSDTGSGSASQPFCTIGAAAAVVTAGQTVDVGAGEYPERVTISRSGTPEQPITFRKPATGSAILTGNSAGFVIDGQHDIVIDDISAQGAVDGPALDIRDSSSITVNGGVFSTQYGSTQIAVRLAGVSRATLTGLQVLGYPSRGGISMDAATTGVTLDSVSVSTDDTETSTEPTVGIRIAGSGNALVNSEVDRFSGAAIQVEPGTTGAVVANNEVHRGSGHGIHNRGATGTAITNNTVKERCRDGIRVDGDSSGVSVQNNVTTANGQSAIICVGVPTGNEIGVHDAATADTVVDYNSVEHTNVPAQAYGWSGTSMSLAAFRTASGQAAHDQHVRFPTGAYDSANSAAPGYRSTDRLGVARVDDPAFANTGAGPVPYADRGAVEVIREATARFDATLDLGALSVTVDASASTPGVAPIASYEFRFGDGAVVTQASPVASHRYAAPGDYQVEVRVVGTDGRTESTARPVSVLRRIASVGLFSAFAGNYVAPATSGGTLLAELPRLTQQGRLDLADAGNGTVAVFSPTAQRYVTAFAGQGAALNLNSQRVANDQRFRLSSNTDGTVSLRAEINGLYVSAESAASVPLATARGTVGLAEKFYRVDVANAGRTFKAKANNRFVTTEGGGIKPLIANRTTAGLWETFDLVDLGGGQVALLAHVNERFVTTEGGGIKPLIANRESVGAWERFQLIRNADGSVSLRALVNSRYVVAENAGAQPLIANRTAIGPWESFILG